MVYSIHLMFVNYKKIKFSCIILSNVNDVVIFKLFDLLLIYSVLIIALLD